MKAQTHPTHRLALALCLSLIAIASSACGSTQSAPGSQHDVVLHARDNHTTVTVTPGSTVRVVLGNTYWTFAPPAGGGVLLPVGKPVVKPDMQQADCVMGQGCGTVTATYHAKNSGVTKITAGRLSCGEALRCPPGRGAYTVTIKVAA
jgi:hypothetical protein